MEGTHLNITNIKNQKEATKMYYFRSIFLFF